MDVNLIIVAVYSYLLGSIPFGLVLTKIFLKKDVRSFGSGNIGATNVNRLIGKKFGIITLILDFLILWDVISQLMESLEISNQHYLARRVLRRGW